MILGPAEDPSACFVKICVFSSILFRKTCCELECRMVEMLAVIGNPWFSHGEKPEPTSRLTKKPWPGRMTHFRLRKNPAISEVYYCTAGKRRGTRNQGWGALWDRWDSRILEDGQIWRRQRIMLSWNERVLKINWEGSFRNRKINWKPTHFIYRKDLLILISGHFFKIGKRCGPKLVILPMCYGCSLPPHPLWLHWVQKSAPFWRENSHQFSA